jgi:hypothetical protein
VAFEHCMGMCVSYCQQLLSQLRFASKPWSVNQLCSPFARVLPKGRLIASIGMSCTLGSCFAGLLLSNAQLYGFEAWLLGDAAEVSGTPLPLPLALLLTTMRWCRSGCCCLGSSCVLLLVPVCLQHVPHSPGFAVSIVGCQWRKPSTRAQESAFAMHRCSSRVASGAALVR